MIKLPPPLPKKTVWMFYDTDEDSGYYDIRLFSTKEKALASYKRNHNEGYSKIEEIEVDAEV